MFPDKTQLEDSDASSVEPNDISEHKSLSPRSQTLYIGT